MALLKALCWALIFIIRTQVSTLEKSMLNRKWAGMKLKKDYHIKIFKVLVR